MQGLCLGELRKLHPEGRGGNRRSSDQTPQRAEFVPWADYIKKSWGFSDDTARRLIQLGDAAKPRLRKLAENAQAGLGAILDKPLSQLSDPEFKALKAVTHKLTDGKTNRMIQEELGLFKGDAKKSKGGKRTSTKGEEDGALPDEAPAGWTQSLWDRYRAISPEQRAAFDAVYLPVLRLVTEFELHWANLPDIERADIDGHLLDMRNRFKSAANEAE